MKDFIPPTNITKTKNHKYPIPRINKKGDIMTNSAKAKINSANANANRIGLTKLITAVIIAIIKASSIL